MSEHEVEPARDGLPVEDIEGVDADTAESPPGMSDDADADTAEDAHRQ